MSGVVGIINLDGIPVDAGLLQSMTECMAYRGPDDLQVWTDEHVGFGHTMLRTTFESQFETQPCTLDRHVWILADARIDDRVRLQRTLQARGCHGLENATDAQMILHAYHVWGKNCVEHLLGDFAFAIWDGTLKCLFCARDHFGIKPFYYARVRNTLVFSNTLKCIRMHPSVSASLNESAIADFLLFGLNQDYTTTAFADIQCLPPAHTLTLTSTTSLSSRRYWTLPIDQPICYRRTDDCVNRFIELLRLAVSDRLRTNRAGILMSGGLDSTSVAATAKDLMSELTPTGELAAFTVAHDRLIPDEERRYAGLVAEALGIPIRYHVVDDYSLFQGWDRPELYFSQPFDVARGALSFDQFRQVCGHSRVGLTGQGGDPGLHPSHSYFIHLFKRFNFGRIALDIVTYLVTNGRLPPLYVRTNLKRLKAKKTWQPVVPPWLNESFSRRLDLAARYGHLTNGQPPADSSRAEAYQSLQSVFWARQFEMFDPDVSLLPLEIRHPFFDLRLMTFLLSLPAVPWCVDKKLLRIAMKGRLPDQVCDRPKAPLAGYPVYELLQQQGAPRIEIFDPCGEVMEYVNIDKFQTIWQRPDKLRPGEECLITRPLSLALWLQRRHAPPGKLKQEKYDGLN